MYNQDDVTLVSVAWNNKAVLELMLKSYVKHHYKGVPLKLGLIDNWSTDGTKEWLRENEVPFIDFNINAGHENALNCLYGMIQTKCCLIADTDLEFLENVYDLYLGFINDKCKLIGEYITRDRLNESVKPRIGAWFCMTDLQAMKDLGLKTFRDKNDWSYDVLSQYTESVLNVGYEIHHIPRLNADIDRDTIGMQYHGFNHFGKLSWNLENHRDREWEVKMRMSYIVDQRLPLYNDIDLKGKFI